ncbi:MAG: DUF1499 domain-containing protein [Chroococcales cyanobacterium]
MSAELQPKKLINRFLIVGIALLLIGIIWAGLRVISPDTPTLFAGSRPTNLGVESGQLAPCPNTPNCVSSQSEDGTHSIAPLSYDAPATAVLGDIERLIQSINSAKIVAKTENYLYAEFTSALMGYVDDVEFYVNEDDNVIEVRSASRLGESDLGVNRKRIEAIRQKLNELYG